MNITFQEISRDFYFSNFTINESGYDNLVDDAIFIGDFGFKNRNDEPVIFKNNIDSISEKSKVIIYFQQKRKDDFYANCELLLSTIRYLGESSNIVNLNIVLFTDNYNYLYKELYSRIYLDTATYNKFKASEFNILLKIILKMFFGYRVSSFFRSLYYRIRRMVRY